MPTVSELKNIAEIDAEIAKLRNRKKEIKQTGKSALRKISTLGRRRERLVEQLRLLDEKIVELKREAQKNPEIPTRSKRGKQVVKEHQPYSIG